MCEYCNLASGDYSILDECQDDELRIENHNNVYEITSAEFTKIIKYCPMCRYKVRRVTK